jgi:hypothetical protein
LLLLILFFLFVFKTRKEWQHLSHDYKERLLSVFWEKLLLCRSKRALKTLCTAICIAHALGSSVNTAVERSLEIVALPTGSKLDHCLMILLNIPPEIDGDCLFFICR